MKINNIIGKQVSVSTKKYLVNWDKPACSKFQTDVRNFFRTFWERHVVLEEFRIPGSLLRIDLINLSLKIVVESSGRQHSDYVAHFHKNRSGYLSSIKRDLEKHNWCEKNGLTILEIFPEDLPFLSRKFFIEKFNTDII